jgi:hypothetical protein
MPSWVVTTPKLKRAPVGLAEAIKVVQQSARARFDETLELSLNLGIDPRRGDQMVRGAATLPHGTGRSVRVCVFAKDDAAQQARDAGVWAWVLCRCRALRRLLEIGACCRCRCCWHCTSHAGDGQGGTAPALHRAALYALAPVSVCPCPFFQVPRWWGMTT